LIFWPQPQGVDPSVGQSQGARLRRMAIDVANEFEKRRGCWKNLKLNPDEFEMSECCLALCQTQDNKLI